MKNPGPKFNSEQIPLQNGGWWERKEDEPPPPFLLGETDEGLDVNGPSGSGKVLLGFHGSHLCTNFLESFYGPSKKKSTLPETNSSHLTKDAILKGKSCSTPTFQVRTVSLRECN